MLSYRSQWIGFNLRQCAASVGAIARRSVRVDVQATADYLENVLGRAGAAALALGLAVEAFLAYRVWAQLTGEPDSGPLRILYALTSLLVAPFRGYETVQVANKDTTLEMASLLAVEVYLASAVGVLLATWLLRNAIQWVAGHLDEGSTPA